MRFSHEKPTKNGNYIVLGDNNIAYNAKYSEKYKTIFFAIPKSVKIIGYCFFENLENIYNINPDMITVGDVYRKDNHWIRCLKKECFENVIKITYGHSIFDTIYLPKRKEGV